MTQDKNELNKILDEKINGILLRAKAEWVEGAEKNTKYFANLEKKKAEGKTIKSLRINDKEITNHEDILKYTKQFYEELYKKDNNLNDNNECFPADHQNKLDERGKDTCEGLLNEEEIGIALKEMKSMKSLGSDGITVEFYQLFWKDIKTFLIQSLNYSFQIE